MGKVTYGLSSRVRFVLLLVCRYDVHSTIERIQPIECHHCYTVVKAYVQGAYRKDTMQIELTMKHTGQGMHEVKRRFGIQQLLSSISH